MRLRMHTYQLMMMSSSGARGVELSNTSSTLRIPRNWRRVVSGPISVAVAAADELLVSTLLLP
eukprot:COSAG02_NODE_3648_length_6426_cov_6.186054_3_plen_63_part_00